MTLSIEQIKLFTSLPCYGKCLLTDVLEDIECGSKLSKRYGGCWDKKCPAHSMNTFKHVTRRWK